MSRLIAFGCSFTYGHGLPDCLLANNEPGDQPSKFSWPYELGKLTNRQVLNLSVPGSSNQEILKRILSTEYMPDDLAVILWTHYSRDELYVDSTFHGHNKDEFGECTVPIGSWMVDHDSYTAETRQLAKFYYLAHQDIDLLNRNWFRIHHAETYLNSINIKNRSFFVEGKTFIDSAMKYLNFKNLSDLSLYSIMFEKFDKADDGTHPGLEAHRQMALEIYKNITCSDD